MARAEDSEERSGYGLGTVVTVGVVGLAVGGIVVAYRNEIKDAANAAANAKGVKDSILSFLGLGDDDKPTGPTAEQQIQDVAQKASDPKEYRRLMVRVFGTLTNARKAERTWLDTGKLRNGVDLKTVAAYTDQQIREASYNINLIGAVRAFLAGARLPVDAPGTVTLDPDDKPNLPPPSSLPGRAGKPMVVK